MSKKKRPTLRNTEVLPHQASAVELAQREASGLAGFVCGSCGWILIQSAGSRRRTCPKCRYSPLRRYAGQGLDDLAAQIYSVELALDAPIGDATFIRNRIAGAVERFNIRKDDWVTATAIVLERSKKAPSRASIAKVYREVRETRHDPPERGQLVPSLEALEHERREAERARLKEIRARKKEEAKPRKRRRR